MPDPAPAQIDAEAASRLRRLNVIVGSLHALQAVVLLAIATAASLPITASFLTDLALGAPRRRYPFARRATV
jgi:hypothetical protein